MKKGDIVLVPFPFTNLKGVKKRPAVILYCGKTDFVVSFITTMLKWRENIDVLLEPDELNRLKKPSLIRTSKLATIDSQLVIGKIGELNSKIIDELDFKLKMLFGLN